MKKYAAVLIGLLLGCVGCGERSTLPSDIDPIESGSEYLSEVLIDTSESGDAEIFDITVSYANWIEDSAIYFGALNNEKLAISSVHHLPIYKFDTLEELESFKESFGVDGVGGYDEILSFDEVSERYDEGFFDDNTLLLVYVEASSGSLRFGVREIFCGEDSLCIHVEQTNSPELCTEDMAGWFITAALSDEAAAGLSELDAELGSVL